jgi:hypothetical protein
MMRPLGAAGSARESVVAWWQIAGGLAVFGPTLALVMLRLRGLSEAVTALLGGAPGQGVQSGAAPA